MATLKKLTGETYHQPTLFAVDTLANHSQTRESDKATPTNDICGLGLETPLADYDPATQYWKMYGDIYLWGDCPLLENLPPSGMTRNGVLFPRPHWVPTTDAIDCLLWPTPRASAAMAEDTENITARMEAGEDYKYKLEQAVAIWPTPRAAMAETRNHTVWARSLDKPQNLENRVAHLEPSAIGGKLNPTWVEWLMGFPTGWTDLED
jgi:hypothetical protein